MRITLYVRPGFLETIHHKLGSKILKFKNK